MKKKITKPIYSLGIVITLSVFGLVYGNNNTMATQHISDSVIQKNGKFENIEPTKVMQGMSASTLKEFFRKGEKVPEKVLPIVPFDASAYTNPDTSELAITWFGHSSVLIQIDGRLILTDPALSASAGPTSVTASKRFHKAIPVKPEELPNLDVVLISHDHYDHLDKKIIQQLADKTSMFIVPSGVEKHLLKWGISEDKITVRSWWQETKYAGIRFIATPARHFSGRGMFDRNKTLWTSWVIQGAQKRVFFSGDSGYQKAFAEIGEKYGPFDLSLMECGQYNKDWSLIHMSPEESAQAAIELQSTYALPIHWGAFSLSVHAWHEPVQRFSVKAEELNLPILTPKIGERLIITDSVKTTNWWRIIQ